jgi:hypothetical protein
MPRVMRPTSYKRPACEYYPIGQVEVSRNFLEGLKNRRDQKVRSTPWFLAEIKTNETELNRMSVSKKI